MASLIAKISSGRKLRDAQVSKSPLHPQWTCRTGGGGRVALVIAPCLNSQPSDSAISRLQVHVARGT